MVDKKALERFHGIIVPILTPVDENDCIDEAALRRQVDFVIEGGVNGILAFGSNGEFYMVTEDEMERGLKIIIDQTAGRVPVFMGLGPISTKTAVRIAKMGIAAGADAVSVLCPPFIKPIDEELYYHFSTIAKAVDGHPMLMYNNPGRTGYTISCDLVERLVNDFDNIVGIKDSSGDMTQTEEFIRRLSPKGFRVFGGKDTLIYSAMAHGGAGAVATTSNFVPKLVQSIYDKYVAGDIKGSLEAQYNLNPIRLMMDKTSWPVATKDYANLQGNNIGDPYKPNLPTRGEKLEIMKKLIKGWE